MKKSSVRLLMLSCFTLAIAGGLSPVMAQSTDSAATQAKAADEVQSSLDALSSANAAAGYTGSTPTGQPAGQPMTPPSLQTGMPATATPGQTEEKPAVMRYNKNKVETGFYGAELPKRLFNNVPSDWSTPLCCKK